MSGEKKLGVWLFAMLFVAIGVLWLRTGIFPAASVGDDPIYGEAAYWFWQEGELKRPWMADSYGGGEQDFFPPIVAIITAALFALLGLSAFSVMASASLAATLLPAAIYWWARSRNASVVLSIAAGLAVFGVLPALEVLIKPRYEPWVATFLVACCALAAPAARTAPFPERLGRSAISGALLAMACITYYPAAPFVLAAGLISAAPVFLRERATSIAFLAGGAIPGVIWGAYFLGHFDSFHAQMKATNAQSVYFSVSNIWLWLQRSGGDVRAAVFSACILAALAAGAAWISRSDPERRRVGWQTILLALPVFLYSRRDVAVLSATFLVLGFLLSAHLSSGPWMRRLVLALAMLGFCGILAVGATAYLDRERRDYAAMQRELLRLVNLEGTFAVNQRGWLALRDKVPASSLHFLPVCGLTQLTPLVSVQVGRADAASYFDYLLIHPGDADNGHLDCFPWTRKAFREGRFVKIGEIGRGAELRDDLKGRLTRLLGGRSPALALDVWKRAP